MSIYLDHTDKYSKQQHILHYYRVKQCYNFEIYKQNQREYLDRINDQPK